ncbi:MAG: iron-containing alcohol dehydrogenase [Oscillospiraceae bacterium]
MFNFSFSLPTRIYFGKGAEQQVGALCAEYGKKVLVHYGTGSIKKNGVYDKVIASLKEAGLTVFELGGVKPNPRLSLVQEGIALVREHGIGFLLAVGGGSAIDSAKAIAVGASYDGDVWDFYCGKAQPKTALPVATVLTIPAAGSESSNSSVITNEDGLLKYGLTNDLLTPKFSIMNPEFTYTLPAYQIACGAADILAHMMERYFVNTPHVDLTDRLIEGSIKTLLEFAPRSIESPTDYDTRAELMWVGTIAHNGLLDTGRGGDWASHGIEHELSALYDIAHGAGLAIIFPAWFEYVSKTNPAKIVQFGRRVFGIDATEEAFVIGETIRRLRAFFRQIGLPVYLHEAGITQEHFDEMAKKAVARRGWGTIGSYVKLTTEDVLAIYTLAQ